MNLAPGDAESMISTDDFQSEASLSPSGHVSSNLQAKNISMRNRLKWRTGTGESHRARTVMLSPRWLLLEENMRLVFFFPQEKPEIQMLVCCSVSQSCPTLCDPMDCSTPGLPVHHQLPVCPSSSPLHW